MNDSTIVRRPRGLVRVSRAADRPWLVLPWGAVCTACAWSVIRMSHSRAVAAAVGHVHAAHRDAVRWRCLVRGCNPGLWSESLALKHRAETGHRVARWPVRSPEGELKQRERYRAFLARRRR